MSEYTWIESGIFTVAEFLSVDECKAYIALSESLGYGDAPINSSLGAVVRKDIRSNDRVMLDDAARAAALWERAKEYVPLAYRQRRAVGFNERLRFYRYDLGQQFDWHYDGAFERRSGERSLISVLMYLNEEFTGGETTFSDASSDRRTIEIVPKTGLALFFDHPILHKGQPVQTGRKYVLRTDVMYSRLL